ncbi:hypothetical protein Tco_0583556, partial [Tanacetum coccineum]
IANAKGVFGEELLGAFRSGEREYMHITVNEHEQRFGLQESVVAEQLFQSSEHAADDLFRPAHSLHPSAQMAAPTRGPWNLGLMRMVLIKDILQIPALSLLQYGSSQAGLYGAGL